jgi:predicted nucleotidyltransferase
MRVEKDYEELLRLLNKHKAKYCIVGSYAVAFYAKPRYTKDIDILIEATPRNGKKLKKALDEFGFKELELSELDFIQKGNIIQLGYEPVRIDILISLQGFDFKDIWENRVEGAYGREKVYFMGLDDLIKSKLLSRRVEDKIDLEVLRQAKKKPGS